MRFVWYCIQNNQGWGRGYKPKPKAEGDTCNPYQDLDYSGYHKSESNNYFIYTLYMYIEQTKMKVMFLFLHCRHHKCWFQKFTVCFWPIRKEIASSMYRYINASNNASFVYISLIYSMYILSRSASSLAQIEIIPSKKLVQIFRCKKTCNN